MNVSFLRKGQYIWYFIGVVLTIGYIISFFVRVDVLTIAGVLTFVLGILAMVLIRKTGYRNVLIAFQDTYGMQYTSEGTPLPPQLQNLQMFRSWNSIRLRAHVRGTIHDRDTVIADTSGFRNIPGSNQTDWIRDLFCFVRIRRRIPGWLLIRSEKTKKLVPGKGYAIQFESTEFNTSVDVYTSEPKLAYRLLDPHLMQLVIDHPHFAILEFNGQEFLLRWIRPERIVPEEEVAFIDSILDQVESNFRREQPSTDLTVKHVTDLSRQGNEG